MNNTTETTSLTLKQFVTSLKQLARKACKENTDLTIWDDSYFYDSPDDGWPIDPFWADDRDTEVFLAINNDKTNKLAIIGVNWYFGDRPYIFIGILTPVVDESHDYGSRIVRCGDDVDRSFPNREEDGYSPTFSPVEGYDLDDERDYTLYRQDGDNIAPEDVIEHALHVISIPITLQDITRQESGIMIEPEPYDGYSLSVTNWATGYANIVEARNEGRVNILRYTGDLGYPVTVDDDNDTLSEVGERDTAEYWTVRNENGYEYTVLAPLGWI